MSIPYLLCLSIIILVDSTVSYISVQKMPKLLDSTSDNNIYGKKTRKQRSRSSVSDKNQIKTGAVKRDGSLSNKRSVVKEGTDIRRSGPERKSLLAAMVPYIRKSIVPIRKLFTANSKAPSSHELCSVCFAPAQVQHGAIMICLSCKEFFHRNACKYEKVHSIEFDFHLNYL